MFLFRFLGASIGGNCRTRWRGEAFLNLILKREANEKEQVLATRKGAGKKFGRLFQIEKFVRFSFFHSKKLVSL